MKHIFSIALIFSFICLRLQGQVTIDCQSEIRLKNQKISDCEKFNSSLQRQNSELQTRISLLISGGSTTSSSLPNNTTTVNCPPSFEKENEQLKKDSVAFKKQVEDLKKVNDTKEALLSNAAENNEKKAESIKILTKTNEDKDAQLKNREQDLTRLNKELEEVKNKLAVLEKAFQDSTTSLIALKTTSQVLYDSLYFSIDLKKDLIHLDIKEADAKDSKLGDILIEMPYTVINSTNWTTNNIEKKLKRIAALYIKYRDKLKIQLVAAPIETEKEKDELNAILIKIIRKLNIYASVAMPIDRQAPITPNDYEIALNNQGKTGFIKIGLVKR